jgi:hypothetical protein
MYYDLAGSCVLGFGLLDNNVQWQTKKGCVAAHRCRVTSGRCTAVGEI